MDLSNDGFEVTEQPTITVDTDYDVMPEAVVGKSYPVPTATAHDLYSDDVEVNVITAFLTLNVCLYARHSVTSDGTGRPICRGTVSAAR